MPDAPRSDTPVGVLATDRKAVTRRGIWVVLGQGMSSITNFTLAVLVLRAVQPDAFGAFTVAQSAYYLTLGVSRAVAGEPQLIRHSHATEHVWRRSASDATGIAIVVGVAGGLVLLLVSWLVGGLLGGTLVALAVVLPGLLLQDAWRYAFFAAGTPAKAFVNDLCWAVAQVALLGWAVAQGTSTAGPFLLAWGAAATFAGLVGVVQTRILPRPGRTFGWASAHRDLFPKLMLDFFLGRTAGWLVLLAIGTISGLAALGTLNAAAMVLGPYRVVALGAVGFAVPEGVRIRRRAPERLALATRSLGVALAILALLSGALALLLPDRIGEQLLGSTWLPAREVVPWATIWVAALGTVEGARCGLLSLAAARQSLVAQAMMAPLILLGGTIGTAAGGAAGAGTGLAVAACAGAGIWWWKFEFTNRASLRDQEYS